MYEPFNFSKVPGEERKFVCLLAKDLTNTEVDWNTKSMKNWAAGLELWNGECRCYVELYYVD